MKYFIQGQKARIKFNTELVVAAYESEGRGCIDIFDKDKSTGLATDSLVKYMFESNWLYIMMFDRMQIYLTIGNDEALDGIKEKLTEIGIEVS